MCWFPCVMMFQTVFWSHGPLLQVKYPFYTFFLNISRIYYSKKDFLTLYNMIPILVKKFFAGLAISLIYCMVNDKSYILSSHIVDTTLTQWLTFLGMGFLDNYTVRSIHLEQSNECRCQSTIEHTYINIPYTLVQTIWLSPEAMSQTNNYMFCNKSFKVYQYLACLLLQPWQNLYNWYLLAWLQAWDAWN